MKISTILLAIALLATISVSSQQASGNDMEQKNHIMFNPFALIFGKIQVQYERALSHNLSLGLSVGAKTSSGVFDTPGLNTATITTNNLSFSGIEFTPEFRWYLQETERNHTGFFLGAYYRYQNYKDELKGVYTSSVTDISSPLDIETSLVSNAVGLEVGYKLPIKKHFYIDFLIAGPGVSFNKSKIQEKQPLPVEFYLIDAGFAIVQEYEFLDALNTKINFNEKGEATFTLPAFHYGIRIGYSF